MIQPLQPRRPELPPLPASYRRRVVVVFRDEVHLPYEDGVQDDAVHLNVLPWDDLTADFGRLSLDRVFFSLTELELSRLEDRARHKHSPLQSSSFRQFYQVEIPPGRDADVLAARLKLQPAVAQAYVATDPTAPPVYPGNDPLRPHQEYLDGAPVGVDVSVAWSLTGGDGAGVTFVDVEQGWNLDHEDLIRKHVRLISGRNVTWKGHGTSVLGIVLAVDNHTGCIGLAPAAKGRVASQWRVRMKTFKYNTEDALLAAAAIVPPGSIVLLESQTDAYLPMEVEEAVFHAIEVMTWLDITVVECAGNGILDLDAYQNAAGAHPLDRNRAGFRDSGAIMVSAGTSGRNTPPPARSRIGYANYGSRADCYAWGEDVVTTGDGNLGTGNAEYLDFPYGFGGTSSAGAIVAGVAVCVQGIAQHLPMGRYLTPGEMRDILSDPATGTQSDQPDIDRMGVMPDLRKIVEHATAGLPLPW